MSDRAVAKAFLVAGLVFLFLGGELALLMRWQLAMPGWQVPLFGKLLWPGSGGAMTPDGYAVLFTLHGTTMIFFALTPIVLNAATVGILPRLVGADRLAFPALSRASLAAFLTSGAVLVASVFTPLGPASSGWTAYAPLSTDVGAPQVGQSLWAVALLLNGLSSLLNAVNVVATVVARPAPSPAWMKLPHAAWGLFLASTLQVLFLPVLSVGLVLLLSDRHLGTSHLIAAAAGGGNPLLWQHLFWTFGHPEVYILILPVWGLVSDLLARFSGKPAFGSNRTILAFCGVTVLSALVYGHHLFTVGLSPLYVESFMTLTLLVSVPSAVFFLNWLGTLWKGSIRLAAPMLFALGVVLVFALGGLTGLHLGAVGTDVYLHDSAFVVGHFHLTMAASVLLGAYAGIYWWFPIATGRRLSETLARWHFGITVPAAIFVFGGMLLLGYGGMMRRLYDPNVYDFLRPMWKWNRAISHAAWALGFAQVIFVVNVVRSLRRGAPAGEDPWA